MPDEAQDNNVSVCNFVYVYVRYNKQLRYQHGQSAKNT